jgi:hypothetical protein
MRIYTAGTVQPRRIGFPISVRDSRKTRPATIPRGFYNMTGCRTIPNMLACCWWDSKPVHFIATGASTQELTTGTMLIVLLVRRSLANPCISEKFMDRWRELSDSVSQISQGLSPPHGWGRYSRPTASAAVLTPALIYVQIVLQDVS